MLEIIERRCEETPYGHRPNLSGGEILALIAAIRAADAVLLPGILGGIDHWPEVKAWKEARSKLEGGK